MNELQFLNHLRNRMKKEPGTPHPGRRPGRVPTGATATAKAELIERFRRELMAVSGHVEHISTPNELRTRLEALRNQLKLQKMLRDDDTCFDRHNYRPWLQAIDGAGFQHIPLNADRYVIADADVGITLADGGVAETGSIALIAAPGRPRFVSLLPPVHIALLPLTRLTAFRAELFAQLSASTDGTRWPSNITFITGPSRTADIESDLSTGVHGPGHVYVFLFD